MSTDKTKSIITLKKGTDKSVFIKDLREEGYQFHENRFARNLCEFFLDDEEKERVLNDSRVRGVDVKKEKRVIFNNFSMYMGEMACIVLEQNAEE